MMGVIKNLTDEYHGEAVKEEDMILQYRLDEEHTPRDLTSEEKTFLNALAGYVMPLDKSLFFQIKDLQRHTKLVLSRNGGRFNSSESPIPDNPEKEFAEFTKMLDNFRDELWQGKLPEENWDLFEILEKLWEIQREKLEKVSDKPTKSTRSVPMGEYFNRGQDSEVIIYIDTIEECAKNNPYDTMLLMGKVLLHEYFHSFHFHVGIGAGEPWKYIEESMVEYGTLVMLDHVASSGLPIAKDAEAALKYMLDRAKGKRKRTQHAAAYGFGAYLYENHKEEAFNLIAQYANVSCLLYKSSEKD